MQVHPWDERDYSALLDDDGLARSQARRAARARASLLPWLIAFGAIIVVAFILLATRPAL